MEILAKAGTNSGVTVIEFFIIIVTAFGTAARWLQWGGLTEAGRQAGGQARVRGVDELERKWGQAQF